MEFTRLEEALLAWFRERSEPIVAQQLRAARLKSRNHTGVGLFVHLHCPDRAAATSGAPFDSDPIPGPEIISPQLPGGAASVLFITDGVPDVLELFSYRNQFPSELSEFSLAEPPPRTE